MKTSKILIVGLTLSFWASFLFADNSQFQVRLVLEGQKAQTIPHDVFPYTSSNGQKGEIAVAKDIVLSAQDVQDVSIRLQEDLLKDLPDAYWTIGPDGYKVLRYSKEDKLNLTAEPRIEFNLTENGRKKFAEFTKNNLLESAAVIGNNRILQKAEIREPITGGKFEIIAHTNKVNEMVKLVESMGLKLRATPMNVKH